MILICTTIPLSESSQGMTTMYVCVCNAVTERQIKQAIYDGANTTQLLKQRLNVAMDCGTCDEHLETCLTETLDSETSGLNLAILK